MPLLVLLPGLDGTGRLFRALQSALAARRIESVAVAYPERVYQSHDALAAEVLGLIPQIRPIVLLGESFGASLALRLAGCAELNVVSVILCAPGWRSPPAPLRWLFSRMPRWLTNSPFLMLGLRMFGMNGAGATACREVADVVRACDWRVLRSRLELLAGLDLPALANALQRPALLIEPSVDRLAVGRSRSWRGAVVRIPGPHFILQAAPERCAEAIAAFLT